MLNTFKKTSPLKIEDILSYYRRGFKKVSDFKIGLEYERLSLNSIDNSPADYNDLVKIIEHFSSIKGWGILKEEGEVIGALSSSSSISLEPGGQFEISLEPKEKISEIEEEIKDFSNLLNSISKSYNIFFLPYGINPKTPYQKIKIIPKKRYELMNKYFKSCGGAFAPVMMRETAGVQVNLDYKNESDGMKKMRASILISPILSGFYSNSVIRNNKKTNYKGFRALSWIYCDKKRCGFFYKNLIEKNEGSFIDYIHSILNVPMIFIEREDKKIEIGGEINFKTFMEKGFKGMYPDINDYILHSSLTFPDVRLKNCIEIRNHDSQDIPLTLSIPAFYKGILYNEKSLDEIFNILDINYEELNELLCLSSKNGIDFDFKGQRASKILKTLFELSYNNLENDEKKYLMPALELLEKGECPSDIIIENNIQNADELISFIKRN